MIAYSNQLPIAWVPLPLVCNRKGTLAITPADVSARIGHMADLSALR